MTHQLRCPGWPAYVEMIDVIIPVACFTSRSMNTWKIRRQNEKGEGGDKNYIKIIDETDEIVEKKDVGSRKGREKGMQNNIRGDERKDV